MSIEVIQPYKPQPIQFSSPDEFNMYYNKHKDDFNETTYKLNVKYKIPGFKITKLKGELKLIKDYAGLKMINTNVDNGVNNTNVERLEASIKLLEERLANVEHWLEQLLQS